MKLSTKGQCGDYTDKENFIRLMQVLQHLIGYASLAIKQGAYNGLNWLRPVRIQTFSCHLVCERV